MRSTPGLEEPGHVRDVVRSPGWGQLVEGLESPAKLDLYSVDSAVSAMACV